MLKKPGKADAVIIGEPTSNIPAVGHKGALYFKATATGKTAHSSMPEKGDNAIYKVARAISIIETLNFGAEKDALLGYPTINIGKVSGGMNINSVPDQAEFTIDVRTTRGMSHTDVIQMLVRKLGPEIVLENLVDLEPVSSGENEPFIQMIYALCSSKGIQLNGPVSLPYVTDGSVLQKLYPGAYNCHSRTRTTGNGAQN